MPKDIEISMIYDRSRSITSLLKVVSTNAIIGFVLVFAVLLLFLDRRSAFWTAMGIPTIFLMVIIYLKSGGFSLNLMSLGAIITVMGILVDDGIVISENIFNYQTAGYAPLEAGIKGTMEVAGPVIISVLTTMAAFLPLVNMGGIMGKMLHVFPLVIITALTFSVLEAFFFLPAHLIHGRTSRTGRDRFAPVMEFYARMLKRILRYRYAVVAGFVVLLILSAFLFRGSIKKFVLIGNSTSDKIVINMEAEEGTTRDRMISKVTLMENVVISALSPKELVAVTSTIGHHNQKPINTEGFQDNWAQISISLVPSTDRKHSAENLVNILRMATGKSIRKEFSLLEIKEKIMGPNPGAPVDIRVVSNDLDKARETAAQVKEKLSSIPGVVDIEDDDRPGKDEIRLVFNKEKMASLGLRVMNVAQDIRTAFEGTLATYIQLADSRLEFRVELAPGFKTDKKFLKNMMIRNSRGRLIRLSAFTDFIETTGPAALRHVNGERAITVSADIDKHKTTPMKVMRQIKTSFRHLENPLADYHIEFGGETKETGTSIKDLLVAFAMAMVGIYFLLLLQFRKAAQPFLVMAIMPFGLIGVFLGFTLHGQAFSFMGVVGIVGLCGVMVNDSVVMTDFINNVFKKNPASTKAEKINLIAEGAKKRLRAVLLTTITTVLGLLPTIFKIGGDAGMVTPVVMALAYGLMAATFVTLILLPSLYMILMDLHLLKFENAG